MPTSNASIPSVRELLLNRLDSGSWPGARNDDYWLVLAVEGGGMRGAVSSGMLLTLEQLGFRDCFDEVVGTSAGAIAGAFFATGQGTSGSVLYYTVLNSQRFVDRRRLLRERAIMDLDYLFDEAIAAHGFDWDALLDNDIPVWATVSPADPNDTPHCFLVGGDVENARQVLKASAALPVLTGRSRQIGDKEYIDGGLTEAVPWSSAIERGATHVLAVRSRGYNQAGLPEELSALERLTVPRLVRRMHNDHVADTVNMSAKRFVNCTEALRSIIEGTGSAVVARGRPVMIDAVLPAEEVELPERLEVDTHLLMNALTGGASAMVKYLDLDGFRVEQRVVVTHPRAPIGRVRTSALAPVVRDRRRSPRRER